MQTQVYISLVGPQNSMYCIFFFSFFILSFLLNFQIFRKYQYLWNVKIP